MIDVVIDIEVPNPKLATAGVAVKTRAIDISLNPGNFVIANASLRSSISVAADGAAVRVSVVYHWPLDLRSSTLAQPGGQGVR
ncbi:hypothetical protein [Dactylosporangium sp. NPDC005555]|uniref:hypothetical protein n=1 Tax=Dactylosporangium sp. NPDC005555 TaxID=3154889 RepID=UPI0033B21C5C